LNFNVKLSKQRSRERLALEEGAAVLIALGLDIMGEPPAAWHPVVWYGKLIRRLEQAAPRGHIPQLLYGIVMLMVAAPAALLPAAIVHQLAKQVRAGATQRGCSHEAIDMCSASYPTINSVMITDEVGYHHRRGSTGSYGGVILYALIEGIGLKPCLALRMLAGAGRSVRLALERGDLPAARNALQSLVSRDCSALTAELAGAAAIESLAENLSDSVVAPLLYYALLGLPGAAMYRLFNTFDSMIGYHGQYEYLGKAAAWLDDVLNVLPARLTALLIIALAPLFGGNRLRAWHIWRRDAYKTASPNAGHPMAAAAGALGLQLEKVGYYTLGDNDTVMTASSVRQAEQMVWSIGCVFVFLIAVFKTLWRAQLLPL
jgi:adenosylcobinamide-phosphate synthase